MFFIVFAHDDVTPPFGPPYWITVHGLYPILPCKLVKFSNKYINLQNGILFYDIYYLLETFSYSVISIQTQKNNVKTSENEIRYSNFNMVEMDKFQELYSRERITLADLKEKQWRGNTQ